MARTQVRLNTQAKQHSLTMSQVKEFAVEIISGLQVKAFGGYARLSEPNNYLLISDATLTLPDDSSMVIAIGIGTEDLNYYVGGAPDNYNYIPVAEVTTASGSVTVITDVRTTCGTELAQAVQLTAGAIKFGIVPSGFINGSNTDFTISPLPRQTEPIALYLNGVRQKLTDDFTYVAATGTITFNAAPNTGDTMVVDYVAEIENLI